MKKLLIALVLGLLLVAALATVASADNGPHGGFSASTDACASCHRVHSAQYGSNALLKAADVEALCLSCHDGTGAGTNVVDGVYAAGSEGTVGSSLFAGGFTNALMATTWSGKVTADPAFNAVSKPTTSHHALGTQATIWGSGANNTPNGGMMLECTSCHTPHGNGGFVNAPLVVGGPVGTVCNPALVATQPCTVAAASYRLLRWQPTGSNGFTAPATSVNWSGGAFPSNAAVGGTTGWTVPDNFATNGTEWYTIGTTGAFAAGDYNAANANNAYNIKNAAATEVNTYIPAGVNVAFFCAQCHDRYFNNSRLRNNTDISAYCGKPTASTSTAVVPIVDDADGVAPWIHPIHPAECQPIVDAANNLINWGDNSPSGDTTYMFRHASGDIRLSMDGTSAAGAGTSVSRSCVACHVAHGTTASMTAYASSTEGTLAQGAGYPAIDNSVLLRMDNRSMCLRCHAGAVGFVVGP